MRSNGRRTAGAAGIFAVLAAFVLVACMSIAARPGAAETGSTTESAWWTLGTAGGPVITVERSQSANLLELGDMLILVDVGSGTVERLAELGHRPLDIDMVFISHLHMDHYGGLHALIGLRWMLHSPVPLTVYGPPGTSEMVSGIVASLEPQARIGFGFGEDDEPPSASVKVIEINDGAELQIGAMKVRAAANTHFVMGPNFGPTSPVSLSYRFDLPDRSFGYTGDTGPSDAVIELFRDVDVLVSEVIALEDVVGSIRIQHPEMPDHVAANLAKHLAEHHLTPEAVGEIARRSGARSVVLTHLAIVGTTDDSAEKLIEGVGREYTGPVIVARDLERH